MDWCNQLAGPVLLLVLPVGMAKESECTQPSDHFMFVLRLKLKPLTLEWLCFHTTILVEALVARCKLANSYGFSVRCTDLLSFHRLTGIGAIPYRFIYLQNH